MTVLAQPVTSDGDAMRLQRILSDYADGKIKLEEVSSRVSQVRPAPPTLNWRQKLAVVLASLFIAMLIPPWAKRND